VKDERGAAAGRKGRERTKRRKTKSNTLGGLAGEERSVSEDGTGRERGTVGIGVPLHFGCTPMNFIPSIYSGHSRY